MGRPQKQGLSYFPIDTDFLDDPKLMFVSARFGIKSEGIVIRLLCKIYRNGYCIDFDDDIALLFARSVGDVGLHGLVNDVVNELLKRGFFDRGMFKMFGILTSRGIQKRYAKVCTDARRVGWEIPVNHDLLSHKPAFPLVETGLTLPESTQSIEENSKEENEGAPAGAEPHIKSFKKWTKEEFVADMKAHGADYAKAMLNDFFRYWSEKNDKGKMKFQLRDTWETAKRLATWNKRESSKP